MPNDDASSKPEHDPDAPSFDPHQDYVEPVFDLADFADYDERQFVSEPLIDDADLPVPPPVTGAPPPATAQDSSATPEDGSAG
ncbi:hypothetical protein [Streptomyces bacillaris]|uniref:hypothetical protein n=1 Tax=Streptomyces bacillaris TaxID=68179 RepID=UPI0036416699